MDKHASVEKPIMPQSIDADNGPAPEEELIQINSGGLDDLFNMDGGANPFGDAFTTEQPVFQNNDNLLNDFDFEPAKQKEISPMKMLSPEPQR